MIGATRWVLVLALPGCSVILNFSDSAGVHDAPAPDAFYTPIECAYDEPNDSLDAAAMITAADTGPAAICSVSDLDFYKFTVPPATTTVTVSITYQERGTTGDLDLSLYDSTGTTISSETDFATTKTIMCPSSAPPVCAALTAGDYTFEVSPSEPGNLNDYTFSIALQ